MTGAPEPRDRFDIATDVAVNGPQDVTLDWSRIDRRAVEADVRRLRSGSSRHRRRAT
jgi:hypothetical protein